MSISTFKHYDTILLANHGACIDAIVGSISTSMTLLEGKLYLFEQFFEYIKQNQIEIFITAIEENAGDDNEKNLLVVNSNPV
jgi:hypothetical protein